MPAGETPTGKRELLVSKTWLQVAGLVVIVGFFVLALLAYQTYKSDPPIPDKVVDPSGRVLFTGNDIRAGQKVFLHHGLMESILESDVDEATCGRTSRRRAQTPGWARHFSRYRRWVTELTQSPWFLKRGLVNVFQPSFLHWSLLVGEASCHDTACQKPLVV